jgi:hypothetical protein
VSLDITFQSRALVRGFLLLGTPVSLGMHAGQYGLASGWAGGAAFEQRTHLGAGRQLAAIEVEHEHSQC